MPPVVAFSGLACGMLLVAFGVTVWDAYRQSPELHHAVQVVGWLAGAALSAGALLAWRHDVTLAAPVQRLLLMAAIASPQRALHRHASPWQGALRIVPALLLAGAGLFLNVRPVSAEAGGVSFGPSGFAALAVIACGGMGTRALAEALSGIISATPPTGWTASGAYAALTLLVSGLALTYLWRRGTVWGETTSVAVLAGAWLAWSAAVIGRRLPSRPRNGLLVAAALLLLCAVVGDPTTNDLWVGADL